MSTRAGSGPARYTRRAEAPAGRDSAKSTPKTRHSKPAASHLPKPYQESADRTQSSSTPGFKTRVNSELETDVVASPASRQRGVSKPVSAHQPKESSPGRGANSAHASDNRGGTTNPRLAKSRIGKLSNKSPGSTPSRSVNSETSGNRSHRLTTSPAAGSRRSATNASRIPKLSAEKPHLSKNELTDLLAVVEKFGESTDDKSDQNYGQTQNTKSESTRTRSSSQEPEESVDHLSNHNGSSEQTNPGFRKESTWRQGDESTGEIGLGGISRHEREERANRPRSRNGVPLDMDFLVGQITPSHPLKVDRHDDKTPVQKDREANDFEDLLELAQGYGAGKIPRANPQKTAPKTAPKPKLSKSELDQLLNFMDSEEMSEDKQRGSSPIEVTNNSEAVHAWRTGDGDDEAMNKLRTKPRDRNAPSQPSDWALEDLVIDEYIKPRSNAKSEEGRGNDTSSKRDTSQPGNSFVGGPGGRNRHTVDSDKHFNLSGFEDFISDTLFDPTDIEKKQKVNNSDVERRTFRHPEATRLSPEPIVERPLRSSRVSGQGSAAPQRNAHSRPQGDEREGSSDGRGNEFEEGQNSGLYFLDEIIPEKKPAVTDPLKRATLPVGSPKSSEQVHSSVKNGSRNKASTYSRSSSDKSTRRQNNQSETKPSDRATQRRSPSSEKANSSHSQRLPSKTPATSHITSPSSTRLPMKSQPSTPMKSRSSTPTKSRSSSPKKSRPSSPAKSRSSCPKKSRSNSPEKYPLASPKKSDRPNPKSYIDSTQKPWPRPRVTAERWRRSRSPSPPKRAPSEDRGSSPDAREQTSRYSLHRRGQQHRSPSPLFSDVKPTENQASFDSEPCSSPTEKRQDVTLRSRPEDSTDNRPKRKSLSLAGMSNPDRDDEGRKLRSLIKSTEVLDRQMFSVSRRWARWSDA